VGGGKVGQRKVVVLKNIEVSSILSTGREAALLILVSRRRRHKQSSTKSPRNHAIQTEYSQWKCSSNSFHSQEKSLRDTPSSATSIPFP